MVITRFTLSFLINLRINFKGEGGGGIDLKVSPKVD